MPNILIVNTPGPQGPVGPQGIQGPSGSLASASSGSYSITGSLTISGSVQILGTASINTLIVNQTQLSTGSNQLGDAADDTQTLYGSVIIPTGSLTVTGSTIISSSASTQLQVGGNLLFVSSSGTVGIGTLSPFYRLDVAGNYRQTQPSGVVGLYYITSANANQVRGTWDFYTNTSITPDFFGKFGFKFEGGTTDSFKQFQIHVGDLFNPRLIVDGAGRTGIGTITPSASLHISGASSSNLLRIDSPATSSILFVTGSGRVGIGTDNPQHNLDTSGSMRLKFSPSGNDRFLIDGATTTRYFIVENGNGFVGIGPGYTTSTLPSVPVDIRGNTSVRGSSVTVGDAFIITNSSPTRLVTVQNTGNVGIGTIDPQIRLHVDASGSANINVPLLLTSVDTNNRVGIRFASSSLSSGRQHTIFHRVNGPTAEWILNASAGESAIWRFQPRDDSNYALNILTPFNGGTAYLTAGVSQSLLSLGAGGQGNQHLNINSLGNVGIGTTTPSASLHISGSSGSVLFEIDSNSQQNILYVSGSGNVGIGTTTPGVTLDVIGNIRSNSSMFNSTTQTQNIRINSATHLALSNLATSTEPVF